MMSILEGHCFDLLSDLSEQESAKAKRFRDPLNGTCRELSAADNENTVLLDVTGSLIHESKQNDIYKNPHYRSHLDLFLAFKRQVMTCTHKHKQAMCSDI